jgi:hypothetical protein
LAASCQLDFFENFFWHLSSPDSISAVFWLRQMNTWAAHGTGAVPN